MMKIPLAIRRAALPAVEHILVQHGCSIVRPPLLQHIFVALPEGCTQPRPGRAIFSDGCEVRVQPKVVSVIIADHTKEVYGEH